MNTLRLQQNIRNNKPITWERRSPWRFWVPPRGFQQNVQFKKSRSLHSFKSISKENYVSVASSAFSLSFCCTQSFKRATLSLAEAEAAQVAGSNINSSNNHIIIIVIIINNLSRVTHLRLSALLKTLLLLSFEPTTIKLLVEILSLLGLSGEWRKIMIRNISSWKCFLSIDLERQANTEN